MALVMSQMPDVWRKVLAEHVPDGTQHCRECHNGGGQASWPCQTYRIAQEAKWVAEGNLPGTGPHGPGPSASPRLSRRGTSYRPEPTYAPPTYASAPPSYDPHKHHGGPPSWTNGHSHPTTGGYPSTGSLPETGAYSGGFRPLAGDPLGTPYPEPAMTGGRPGGDQPYGSTFDAPYGASFGVDDRPHAARY